MDSAHRWERWKKIFRPLLLGMAAAVGWIVSMYCVYVIQASYDDALWLSNAGPWNLTMIPSIVWLSWTVFLILTVVWLVLLRKTGWQRFGLGIVAALTAVVWIPTELLVGTKYQHWDRYTEYHDSHSEIYLQEVGWVNSGEGIRFGLFIFSLALFTSLVIGWALRNRKKRRTRREHGIIAR